MFNNKHPSTNTITQIAWGKDKITAKYRQVEKYYQIVGDFWRVCKCFING
ncbi:hypothetical protein ACSQ6I_28210 [Anabaena sp. WFMT]